MKSNYTFNDFMRAVDISCQNTIGCSAHDLADYPYQEDWQVWLEELAFIAPEDYNRRIQVFRNHVGYTVDDLQMENNLDAYPYL